MNEKKRILICPLNWGLGHAARDVILIKLFIKYNFEPIIAASGNSLKLLNGEFPELKKIDFPGYSIRFSRYRSQVLKMLFLIPKIILWVLKEQIVLKSIIEEHKIDIVFSDNRFGLWNKKTYNIFMTHQLKVLFPGVLKIFEPIYQFLSFNLIKRFDECWIPDFEGDVNLSGELSHSACKLKNTYFIGPLSKFVNSEYKNKNSKYDILFILSGPEPQRTILEEKIYKQTLSSNLKCALVCGTFEDCSHKFKFPVFNILNTESLFDLISKSKIVVCRSGYSSVMDLFLLRKTAIFIPTPGQTEQEYLAKYLHKRGLFYSVSQRELDLNMLLENTINFPKIPSIKTSKLERRLITLQEMYYN